MEVGVKILKEDTEKGKLTYVSHCESQLLANLESQSAYLCFMLCSLLDLCRSATLQLLKRGGPRHICTSRKAQDPGPARSARVAFRTATVSPRRSASDKANGSREICL